MSTLSKPVLYNEIIAGMPNKTHKGIFLDIMLRKGTSYNGIKTTQSLVKKTPNTKTNQKMTTEIPKTLTNQPVLSQISLQQNMEQ